MRSPHGSISSILITNIRLIGDVVLTTPLIGLFRQLFPGAAIDFLVNRGTGEFLEKDPRVRRVIYSEKWQKGSTGAAGGYLMTIAGRYDLAVCLNPSDRGTLATVLAGRKQRVGYYEDDKPLGRLWRKLLLSHALPYDPEQHPAARCGQIAELLGDAVRPLPVEIHWDDADRAAVADTLARGGVANGYFVVHPFARWRYKYWDIAGFVEVSDRVAQRYGLRPVWTSSPDPDEVAQVHEAAARCAVTPLVVPGRFSLNQMACLLRGARLYLGLDTAITHIAAAVGAPLVALYGPTEIWRWHPWDNAALPKNPLPTGYRGAYRSGNVVALQAACEHYPCIRPGCYREGLENPCMMAIGAGEVCAEVERLVQTGFVQVEPQDVSEP